MTLDDPNQRWLEYAPKPPERGANLYDVFISYRSSDRTWAMALYDALKLAGWEPFLDQYELVPGSNLENSLEESLAASSSGVIIWSRRTIDSVWCQRERQSMMTLRDRGGFKYLFAKLDAQPLPLFAQADLWVEFGDSPEGPRGFNLLKLLCGMKDCKPDPAAVKLAEEVDEKASETLIRIKAAVEAGNADRLKQIGTSKDLGVVASPVALVEAARGLISMKAPADALDVLGHAKQLFPKSIRVKQLQGLAFRRLGRFDEAIDVLSELKAAGHQDPETIGMLAAAWDGRYQKTGKRINLYKSRELYRTAFVADPKDYYTGVNAASKSLFLGEADESARLAALVQPLVAKAKDGNDFWGGCTLAEVYLLQGALDDARQQYQRIIDNHGTLVGHLEGTFEQAKRICSALKLTEDETKKVLAPFELLDS